MLSFTACRTLICQKYLPSPFGLGDFSSQSNIFLMKKYLLLPSFLLAFASVMAQTSFNHPLSGVQTITLGPGVYNYYDNGGPNGNYSNNIDASVIEFEPIQGHFISVWYQSFELEPPGPSGCWDFMEVSFIDCNFFSPVNSFCEFPNPPGEQFCRDGKLKFSFTSDFTGTASGWRIQLTVLPKTPANTVCTDNPCFDFLEDLDCDGGIDPTLKESAGSDSRELRYYECTGFWPNAICGGAIDYYPGCDNEYYPQREIVHFLSLDDTKSLFLSCECFEAIFAVKEGGCACQKFVKDGNDFTLDNLAPGNYYIIGELACNPPSCECDFVFQCNDPGPGLLDCSNPIPIDCGETVFSSNSASDGGVNNVNSYCSPPLDFGWTGREKVYSFQPDFNGLVYISLTGLTADLDLFLLKDCDRTSCLKISDNPGFSSEFIEIEVKKGESFFIVVDGWKFAQSSYLLEIQCEKEQECVECGKCFTYSLVNKGLNTDVVCRSKYNDCTIPVFPSPAHSFRWTVDGVQVSTAQNPTISVPTNKQVTICQEIRLNGNVIYSCCWEVEPAPGCQPPPVAHWSLFSALLDTMATYNASGSKGGDRYFWDFGDGSPIVSTGKDTLGSKKWHSPEKSTCVYVQNPWGLSQYCKDVAPLAFECSSSPSPKFDYALNGNTITITSDDPFGVIKQWEIDFGNGNTVNGTNWITQTHNYSSAGTYEVCIRFRVESGTSFGFPCSFQGCLYFTVKVGCCTTVQNDCPGLRYQFVNAMGGLRYNLSKPANLNQAILGWEIDDVPVPQSGSSSIQYLFPVAGLYKICFVYRDPSTGCFVKCCRLIWIGDPFDCGSILFLYESGKGYQFYTNADGTNFSWTNDDTGENLGSGKITNFIPVPGPGDCIEANISVRYYDPACQCWRICCLRIYLCDPKECTSEIIPITNPGPNPSTALCVDNSYKDVRWFCQDNNQFLGSGNCLNVTGLSCQNFCVQYYDPVAKRYRVCCSDWKSSLSEPESLRVVEIRPNPFGATLDVKVEFVTPLGVRLELLDAQGRIVEESRSERDPDMLHQWQLDTRHLADGVYVLRIITAEGEVIRKVIKLEAP